MSAPQTMLDEATRQLAPHVGELAVRLIKTFKPEANPADADRLALVEKVLAFAATAEQRLTEQRQRIAELESLSMTDALTGSPNRRALDDFLKRMLAAAHRYGEGGSIAYFDLDNFKAINDSFGHAAGDKVLRHVARILTHNSRVCDFVAHLHGDEFVIVMVRTDPVPGVKHCRRLQQLIAASDVRHNGKRLPVTASFGVAAYGPNSDPQGLLRQADRAMYRNKRALRARQSLKVAG